MSTHPLRRVFAASVVALLTFAAGCSSPPRQVKCDGRLEPINPPPLTHVAAEPANAPAASQRAARTPGAEAGAPP